MHFDATGRLDGHEFHVFRRPTPLTDEEGILIVSTRIRNLLPVLPCAPLSRLADFEAGWHGRTLAQADSVDFGDSGLTYEELCAVWALPHFSNTQPVFGITANGRVFGGSTTNSGNTLTVALFAASDPSDCLRRIGTHFAPKVWFVLSELIGECHKAPSELEDYLAELHEATYIQDAMAGFCRYMPRRVEGGGLASYHYAYNLSTQTCKDWVASLGEDEYWEKLGLWVGFIGDTQVEDDEKNRVFRGRHYLTCRVCTSYRLDQQIGRIDRIFRDGDDRTAEAVDQALGLSDMDVIAMGRTDQAHPQTDAGHWYYGAEQIDERIRPLEITRDSFLASIERIGKFSLSSADRESLLAPGLTWAGLFGSVRGYRPNPDPVVFYG